MCYIICLILVLYMDNQWHHVSQRYLFAMFNIFFDTQYKCLVETIFSLLYVLYHLLGFKSIPLALNMSAYIYIMHKIKTKKQYIHHAVNTKTKRSANILSAYKDIYI